MNFHDALGDLEGSEDTSQWLNLDEDWKDFCVGEPYLGHLTGYPPLDCDDIADFVQRNQDLLDDSDIPYGTPSQVSLVYSSASQRGSVSRVVCVIDSHNLDCGEVYIRVSENPDKPLITVYPDLIGPARLHRYHGRLRSFQNFKHRIVLFGGEVPERMIGPVIMYSPMSSVFGFLPRPVAIRPSSGSESHILAALVGIDSSDVFTPLIIRVFADPQMPCIKRALNHDVHWMW